MSNRSHENATSAPPSRQRFFVIDVTATLFRCHYAPMRRITTPDGQPAKAMFRFFQELVRLVREQRPDYLALVMADPTLSQADPSAQKPEREPLPQDVVRQIEPLLEMVASSVPVISMPGRDAADLIATLIRRVADPAISIVLVSSNRCLHQLLDDRVVMFNPARNETMGPAELLAWHRYRPDQVVDVLTLYSIKGIGRRTAIRLLATYGTAREAVYHAEQLPPNIRDQVRTFGPLMDAARQHAMLDTDVPVTFDLEACRWRGFDRVALGAAFRRLGFHRLRDEMMAGDHASA